MNSSARLVVQIGAQPDRTYPIERDITIAGREAINDLVVNDAEVSRRHARFLREPEGIQIEDLGSTNGTFINGRRVTVPTLLYHGDVVEMGKSARLIFQLDQPYDQVTKPIEMEQPAAPVVPDEPIFEDDPYTPPPVENIASSASPYAPNFQEQAPPAYDPPAYDPPAYDPPPPAEPLTPPAPPPTYEPPSYDDVPPKPIYEEAFSEYEEEDSAEFYRPPAQSINADINAPDYEAEVESSGCQRYFMTCGCLALLFIFLLGAALFILDSVAPEFLYCGPLQGLWEAILQPILRLTGRVWVCP